MSDVADEFDMPGGAGAFHQDAQVPRRGAKPKRDRRQDPNVPDDHETRFNAAMMALGVNQPSARVTVTRLRPSEDKLPAVRGAAVPTYDDFVKHVRDTHWSGDNEEYDWIIYNGRSQYQKRGRLTIAEDPVKQAQFRAERKRKIDEIRSMSEGGAAPMQAPPIAPPIAPPVPPLGHYYPQPQPYQPPMPPPQQHYAQQPPMAPPPPQQQHYAQHPQQPAPQQQFRRQEPEPEEEEPDYEQPPPRQRRDHRDRDRDMSYRPRPEYEYEPEPQRYYGGPPVAPPVVPIPVPAVDPRMDAMSAELRQVMDVVRSLSAELGGAKAVSREINPQIAEIHRVAADLQRQMEQYQQQRQMEAAQPPPVQQQAYQQQPTPQQVHDQDQHARRVNRARRVPEGYMLALLSGDPDDPPVLVPIPPGMPGHRPDMVPGYVAGLPAGAPPGMATPYGYQPPQQAPPPPPPPQQIAPPREEGGDLERGITGILGMIERTEHAKQTLSRSLGLVDKASIVAAEKDDAPATPASNIPAYEDLGFWKFNKRDDGKLDMNPLNSFMLNLDKVKDLVGSVTEGAAKLQREQAKAENDELERRVALEERLARVRQGSVHTAPVQPSAPYQTQTAHSPVHSGLPRASGVNEFRQNPMTSVPSGGDDDSADDDPSPFGL